MKFPSTDSQKSNATILVIITGMLVLYWLFQWAGFLYIATAISLSATLIPATAPWIARGWNALAQILGKINGTILLSIVFIVFLVPISWCYRLFVKDKLRLKPTSSSLFHERNHTFTKKDLENPW